MEIVVKCLTTLQHLFSWLPLSSHVPPSLVTTVFYWGSIATQSQVIEIIVKLKQLIIIEILNLLNIKKNVYILFSPIFYILN